MIGSQILDQNLAFQFLFGGVAHTTLKSLRTGKQFSYRIVKKDGEPPIHSVSAFIKPRQRKYQIGWYDIGFIRGGELVPYRGSIMRTTDAAFLALKWALEHLPKGTAKDLEIWHQGECGRCGRTLTHPESINTGFGPECIKTVRIA